MRNTQFQAYKIKREILVNGETFTFYHPVLNEFGEPTGEGEEIAIKGLYHTSKEYVSISRGDSTTARNRQNPLILCTMEDAALIQIADRININGGRYRVSGVTNYNNANFATDISLEEIQDEHTGV